jgi:hypothetical protein
MRFHLLARRRPSRQHSLRLLTLALIAGVISLTWQSGAATAAEAPRLSAIEIADGVLYNDGAAAPFLTSLRRGPGPEWNETARRTQQLIHQSIGSDPRFAASFAERMQSGDPMRVRNALTGLGRITRQVLDRQFGRDAVTGMIEKLDSLFGDYKLFGGAGLVLQYEFDLDYHNSREFVTAHADGQGEIDGTIDGAVMVFVVPTIFDGGRGFSDRSIHFAEIVTNDIAAGLRARRGR